MKYSQSVLIVSLLFTLFLAGCTGIKLPETKSLATYNIIVPASSFMRDVSLTIKDEQVSFIKNNRIIAVAKVRPAPPPPPPCTGGACTPPPFKFTLIDRNTAEIFYPDLDKKFTLDITNVSDELVKGIRELPNQSFEAQPLVQEIR